MNTVIKLLLALIVLVIAGGAVFLMTWDIPAPSAAVERPIPDSQIGQ